MLLTLLMVMAEWAPAVAFETPPERAGFLMKPVSLAVDGQGRVHLLDVAAFTVFVWRKDGGFERAFGRKGPGPREFTFDQGAYARVFYDGRDILVFDASRQRQTLHRIAPDGTWRDELSWPVSGRTLTAAAWGHGWFLHLQDYGIRPPESRLTLYDADRRKVRDLARYPDTAFKHRVKDGRFIGWTAHAFHAKKYVSYADHGFPYIAMARCDTPVIELVPVKGGATRRLELRLKRKPVADADRKEFLELPYMANPNNRAVFPDFHPYFNGLLGFGDHLLAYVQSPVRRRTEGWVISLEDGRRTAPWSLELGEGGGLFASANRLFALTVDDDGEFRLQELRPPLRR